MELPGGDDVSQSAVAFLDRNEPELVTVEGLAPYKEFEIGAETYYFTPGGFLYRKDPGSEEVGGFFCRYLTDEVWHRRIDNG